ncbi:MAG: hypothetical protein JNK63_08360 [Chthonomonas sp.]|nr:hypothetical protein [Chthonomonas sp.]
MTELPKIIGGLLAIAALSASLFNGVDPIQCLIRGAIAWIIGSAAGAMWNLFFSKPTPVRLILESTASGTNQAQASPEEPESKLAA